MKPHSVRVAIKSLLGAACLIPCMAQAAAPAIANACSGELGQPLLTLTPKTAAVPDSNGGFTNRIASCNMWQNFFYLNWPAVAGQAGVPNTKAVFGAPGATVWQTFASPEQVFLPNGKKPGPWGSQAIEADIPSAIAQQVRAGKLRVLRRVVKISDEQAKLQDLDQVDGLVLYDQKTNPVYYEVMLNQTLYDYIVGHQLYESASQAAYAAKNAIAPPIGSFEIKAAWKILYGPEITNGRFFTSSAYVIPPGGKGSVQTVGLVGLHIFAGGGSDTGNTAGLWATFAQVDNAPRADQAQPSGVYNFYNKASKTTANTPTMVNGKQVPAVTQVTQVWPDDPDAAAVTKYAQSLVAANNQNAPWQYYKLINTQWPRGSYSATAPVPQNAPLSLTGSAGAPNTEKLLNPVIETYMQITQGQVASQRSCMACHAYSKVADQNLKYATGFSFLFGRAQAASAGKAGSGR